jgi:putative membrane protein
MAQTTLTAEHRQQIQAAVAAAEAKTSGEIATAIIDESSDYAIFELLFGVLVGFVYFMIMAFFYPAINGWIQSLFWDFKPVYTVMFYGFSTFLIITLCYFLANLASIDRLIVPRGVMQEKVQNRAMRHFMESGVYNTKDRTGILIFISRLERKVILLADSGINAKIEQQQWDGILQGVIEGIRNRTLASSLCTAIETCGTLLATHFPIQADDVNELHDGIVELER